ncbi:MAG: plasmid mobilization relaxosome protein MobC [Geminicoccaceae bacterium]
MSGPVEYLSGAAHPFATAAHNYRLGRGRGSVRITLRLTDEEAAKLERMSAGMTVSAFVRGCVFGDRSARRRPRDRRPVASEIELAQALAMLGQSRIANNLNQLAYQANTGTLALDEGVHRQIEEAYAYVAAMRKSLLHALGRTVDDRP